MVQPDVSFFKPSKPQQRLLSYLSAPGKTIPNMLSDKDVFKYPVCHAEGR
jgi:hypothetical protein